jgi:hypothetical protein
MAMTQAYIEGFCKAAEAYGVDPQKLMKAAALPTAFLPKHLLSTVIGAGRTNITPRMLRQMSMWDRLQALQSRMGWRQGAVRTADRIIKLHYPTNIPPSISDALTRANAAAWQDAANARLKRILDSEAVAKVRKGISEGSDDFLTRAWLGK